VPFSHPQSATAWIELLSAEPAFDNIAASYD